MALQKTSMRSCDHCYQPMPVFQHRYYCPNCTQCLHKDTRQHVAEHGSCIDAHKPTCFPWEPVDDG
jgi:Zn finger protein HypA/HybF involved in hydrogenase expression